MTRDEAIRLLLAIRTDLVTKQDVYFQSVQGNILAGMVNYGSVVSAPQVSGGNVDNLIGFNSSLNLSNFATQQVRSYGAVQQIDSTLKKFDELIEEVRSTQSTKTTMLQKLGALAGFLSPLSTILQSIVELVND